MKVVILKGIKCKLIDHMKSQGLPLFKLGNCTLQCRNPLCNISPCICLLIIIIVCSSISDLLCATGTCVDFSSFFLSVLAEQIESFQIKCACVLSSCLEYDTQWSLITNRGLQNVCRKFAESSYTVNI